MKSDNTKKKKGNWNWMEMEISKKCGDIDAATMLKTTNAARRSE